MVEDNKEKRESYIKKIPIGPPKLTVFEKARIIGIRALQIDYGAPPFINAEEGMSSIEIAKRELEEKALPLSIKRRVLDREYPPIPINWLLEAEKEDLDIKV